MVFPEGKIVSAATQVGHVFIRAYNKQVYIPPDNPQTLVKIWKSSNS